MSGEAQQEEWSLDCLVPETEAQKGRGPERDDGDKVSRCKGPLQPTLSIPLARESWCQRCPAPFPPVLWGQALLSPRDDSRCHGLSLGPASAPRLPAGLLCTLLGPHPSQQEEGGGFLKASGGFVSAWVPVLRRSSNPPAPPSQQASHSSFACPMSLHQAHLWGPRPTSLSVSFPCSCLVATTCQP